MRGSTGSKQVKPGRPSFPVPQTLGLFLCPIALLSCIAGAWRGELALTLLGAVFLAVLGYSFLAAAILALVYRNRARSLSVGISPREISAGETAALSFGPGPDTRPGALPGRGRFFRFPGILIRYGVRLQTRDGRRIRLFLDPPPLEGTKTPLPRLPPAGRGAYYGDYDELCILDALGLFRAAFRLPQESGPRLLVSPLSAAEVPAAAVRAGGEEQRRAVSIQRTDNLTSHRPYIPGDDPRRINWKLYGHAGDLFVREGEPEPPPHSKLVILVDTQADPGLYTAESARRGVDLLCENALALALEYAGRGMDMSLGYTGGPIRGGTRPELASILAYPAALLLGSAAPDLPLPGESRGALVLALPRIAQETALDRFIKNRGSLREVDILFMYEGEGPAAEAASNAAYYNRKSGVRARSLGLAANPPG